MKGVTLIYHYFIVNHTVFPVQRADGQNISIAEAEGVCAQFGARLSTITEFLNAKTAGLHLCRSVS